jgi:DnaJ-domain-containing protein 1
VNQRSEGEKLASQETRLQQVARQNLVDLLKDVEVHLHTSTYLHDVRENNLLIKINANMHLLSITSEVTLAL